MPRKLIVLASLSLVLVPPLAWGGAFPCRKWFVTPPVFQPVKQGAFENVAVKDPSIVYYDGRYHLFYTGKRAEKTTRGVQYRVATGYVSAPTLEALNRAQRHNLSKIVGATIIAPQIFYFAPRKLWYLIAHRPDPGHQPNLKPIYLTNPDINNVHGWSQPRDLITDKGNKEFWIDFWVICDAQKAHLFYANQKGSVLRRECAIAEFPAGLDHAKESVAVTGFGEDETGKWMLFEAEHVYHVRNPGKYFMIAECGYYNEARKYFADARRRFLIGMVADRLKGPWTRIEADNNEFFATAKYLFTEDGGKSAYTQVSHPELIRCGYDQKLEIESFDIDMLFQSFDGSNWPDDYNYNELPWELAIMKNH